MYTFNKESYYRIGLIAIIIISGFLWTSSVLSQETVVSWVIPASVHLRTSDTVAVRIFFDMSGTSELLGSFSGSLNWEPAYLRMDSNSGIGAGFSGFVNTDQAENGLLKFNGANPNGGSDTLEVLDVFYTIISTSGSTTLDLEYTAVSAAQNFRDLLPILVVHDGSIITAVKETESGPIGFSLSQNYPNPFRVGAKSQFTGNPETVIHFRLPETWVESVELKVYNIRGQLVKTLVDGKISPGSQKIVWDGRDAFGRLLPTGVYFYRIISGDFVAMRRMLLAK